MERLAAEGQSKRSYSQESKDFMVICRLLEGCVGEDYMDGLVQQKHYE